MAWARDLVALVFFFPSVMSFSAKRCTSLALARDVLILSCSIRDVTMLRRRACRWAELRER
jgi:hypothetical protein